jgi:hypothetical protein
MLASDCGKIACGGSEEKAWPHRHSARQRSRGKNSTGITGIDLSYPNIIERSVLKESRSQ